MDAEAVATLIEERVDGASATVEPSRHAADEDHLRAVVVSPAFEGLSLVEQHQRVYEALGDHMTRDIHALELTTLTPGEADARK